MYTKSEFGKDLEIQLAHSSDIVYLSDWAHEIYLLNCRDFEEGLVDVVIQLIAMQEGEEFEFTIEELKELAHRLQKQK